MRTIEERMKSDYKRANQLVLEQFNAHMSKILPKPELLPIRLDIILKKPQKDDLIENVFEVKPFDTVESLIS